jgi:hypothetical protein
MRHRPENVYRDAGDEVPSTISACDPTVAAKGVHGEFQNA